MNRIHKVLIGLGLLILMVLLISRFAFKKEIHYTVESSVKLLREDPTAIEAEKEDASDSSILFTNDTTEPLAARTEKETKIFKPRESGHLMLPAGQELPTLSIARRNVGDAKLIFQARVFPYSRLTAYEDSSGNFRVESVRNQTPNQAGDGNSE